MDRVSRLTEWLGAAAGRALGPAAEPDDWQLWRQARSGQAASAARLVRELTPQAYGLAIRLVGRREDAEDAVQEAFLRLWRSEPSDTRGARLSTYFNTIVLNRCRSLLVGRREQPTEHEALTVLHDAHQSSGAATDGDPGPAAWGEADARARLARGLARLPARQRMAIAMWTYADASVAEIARTLELDPNAAHQLLHRAKQALRAQLEGEAP